MKNLFFGIIISMSMGGAWAGNCDSCKLFTSTSMLHLSSVFSSAELAIAEAERDYLLTKDVKGYSRAMDVIIAEHNKAKVVVQSSYKTAVASAGDNSALKGLLRDFMAKWLATLEPMITDVSERGGVRNQRFNQTSKELQEIARKIELEAEL